MSFLSSRLGNSVNMEDISDASGCSYLETGDDLCDSCREIDLSSAKIIQGTSFQKIKSEGEIPSASFLGALNPFSDFCKLCRLLSYTIDHGYDYSEESDYQLLVLPSPLSYYKHKEASAPLNRNQPAWLRPFLCGRDSQSILGTIEGEIGNAEAYGWIGLFFDTGNVGIFGHRWTGEIFDASLVKDWLSACHKFHLRCLDTPISVPDLWLIECDTLKVIEAPENASYIALSYVWAKSLRDEEQIPLNKGTGEKPYQLSQDMLSQVIKDSVTVTKQLGFHYLWVDKYCIDQNNPTVKHHQINNMDLIYRGADFTIIATAGEDEHHGLPGVGAKRIPCEKVKIGGYTLTHVPSEIRYASRLSVWGRRGWTFQEELLSNHRLYFSDYQVSMLCQEMLCCEARVSAECLMEEDDMEAFSTYSVNQLGISEITELSHYDSSNRPSYSDQIECLRKIWCLIADYSRRHLTFESDVLRAFAGIQRVFEEKASVFHLQGLPIIYQDSESSHFSNTLIQALTWEHCIPFRARRLTQFPTWTWAGWSGTVTLHGDDIEIVGTNLCFIIDERTVSVAYDDDTVVTTVQLISILAAQRSVSMKRRQRQYGMQGNQSRRPVQPNIRDFSIPRALIFKAPMITEKHLTFKDSNDWKTGEFMGIPWSLYGLLNPPSTLPFTPLNFLNGIQSKKLGCILLRICNWTSRSCSYLVDLLILEWRGEKEGLRIGKLTARLDRERGRLFNPSRFVSTLEWREVKLV